MAPGGCLRWPTGGAVHGKWERDREREKERERENMWGSGYSQKKKGRGTRVRCFGREKELFKNNSSLFFFPQKNKTKEELFKIYYFLKKRRTKHKLVLPKVKRVQYKAKKSYCVN